MGFGGARQGRPRGDGGRGRGAAPPPPPVPLGPPRLAPPPAPAPTRGAFLGAGPETGGGTAAEVLEAAGLPPARAREALTRWPRAEALSAPGLQERVQLLSDIAGLRGRDLATAVERNPAVLWMSADALEAKVAWLQCLGQNASWVPTVLTRHPSLLAMRLDTLEGRVAWLEEEGFDASQRQRILKFFPQVLMRNELSMQDRLVWLEAEAGLGEAGARRAAHRAPALLGVSYAALEERWEWLQGLGLEPGQLAFLVGRAPQVLAHSVDYLGARVEWLAARGLRTDQVAKCLSRAPEVLLQTLGRMEARVACLEAMGLEGTELVDTLCTYPRVLLYSPESIRAKLGFLTGKGFPVVRAVRCMTYSLGRMRARVAAWERSATREAARIGSGGGDDVACGGRRGGQPTPMALFAPSDEEFAARLGMSAEAYAAIVEDIEGEGRGKG